MIVPKEIRVPEPGEFLKIIQFDAAGELIRQIAKVVTVETQHVLLEFPDEIDAWGDARRKWIPRCFVAVYDRPITLVPMTSPDTDGFALSDAGTLPRLRSE